MGLFPLKGAAAAKLGNAAGEGGVIWEPSMFKPKDARPWNSKMEEQLFGVSSVAQIQ